MFLREILCFYIRKPYEVLLNSCPYLRISHFLSQMTKLFKDKNILWYFLFPHFRSVLTCMLQKGSSLHMAGLIESLVKEDLIIPDTFVFYND